MAKPRRRRKIGSKKRRTRWKIRHKIPLAGLTFKDIFEGRIIPWHGEVFLGPVCCFHPREAQKAINSLINQAAQEGQLGFHLVFKMAKMYLKYSRFRNISIERIYSLAFASQ